MKAPITKNRNQSFHKIIRLGSYPNKTWLWCCGVVACKWKPLQVIWLVSFRRNQRTAKRKYATCLKRLDYGIKGFAENLSAIITIVGDLSAYPFERDRHLIYIDRYLAAMQLMLALETLGLSTCSINWPEVDANERKIRKVIKLKDYERVIMLLAVGYADSSGGIPYSQKKENQLILEDISQ